jgi:hypothetical protein
MLVDIAPPFSKSARPRRDLAKRSVTLLFSIEYSGAVGGSALASPQRYPVYGAGVQA